MKSDGRPIQPVASELRVDAFTRITAPSFRRKKAAIGRGADVTAGNNALSVDLGRFIASQEGDMQPPAADSLRCPSG